VPDLSQLVNGKLDAIVEDVAEIKTDVKELRHSISRQGERLGEDEQRLAVVEYKANSALSLPWKLWGGFTALFVGVLIAFWNWMSGR